MLITHFEHDVKLKSESIQLVSGPVGKFEVHLYTLDGKYVVFGLGLDFLLYMGASIISCVSCFTLDHSHTIQALEIQL